MNFLATNIAFDPDQKQHMLEERDVKKRGYLLYALLMREEQLVEIKANIQSRTREDLSQQQRDHFLQQQIRTIQEELGTDIDDIDELQERASKMKWNEDVQKHFEKELRKLERLNPQSPDYSVQYAYLDNMLNLPWDTYTEDNFDLKKVEEKLNADHYGLIHDYNKQSVAQSRGHHKGNATPIDETSPTLERKQNGTRHARKDRNPSLPSRELTKEHHDQSHHDGINIEDARGDAGRNVFVCLKQSNTTPSEQYTQDGHKAKLLPRDANLFLSHQHKG